MKARACGGGWAGCGCFWISTGSAGTSRLAKTVENVKNLTHVSLGNPDVIANIVEAGGRRHAVPINDRHTSGARAKKRGCRRCEDEGRPTRTHARTQSGTTVHSAVEVIDTVSVVKSH